MCVRVCVQEEQADRVERQPGPGEGAALKVVIM